MMNKKHYISKSSFILLFLLIYHLAFSHPHVFIDYESSFIFKKGALVGVDIKWYFDEFFSVSTIKNFDRNANGKLEPDELEDFKKITYEGIGEYNFFINLTINGKMIYIEDIKNFIIKIPKKNLVIYEFTIPCYVVSNKKTIIINLFFEDPTYYVAITTSQKNINVKNDKSVDIINCEIIDEYENKIEFKKQ